MPIGVHHSNTFGLLIKSTSRISEVHALFKKDETAAVGNGQVVPGVGTTTRRWDLLRIKVTQAMGAATPPFMRTQPGNLWDWVGSFT